MNALARIARDMSEMRFESLDEAERAAADLTAEVAAVFGDSTSYFAFWDCRGYWTLAQVHTYLTPKEAVA